MGLDQGLELIAAGEFFAAHEELEDEWREAPPEERDFLQGLVHVAVAWYQAGRGRRPGCERQLEKAARRLGPYAPHHRGVDVAATRCQGARRAVSNAAAAVAAAQAPISPAASAVAFPLAGGDPITPPRPSEAITEPTDAHVMSDPAEAADEMLNAEANEPTEPMLSAEPTEPMLSTDPCDAIDSSEPSDHNDHFETGMAHGLRRTRLRRVGAHSGRGGRWLRVGRRAGALRW